MDTQKNSSGGSANSFLLGFLFGIAAALLFTTKKGRQLLRTITDESITKFSDIESLIEKKVHTSDEEELVGDLGDDYVETEARGAVSEQVPSSDVRVSHPIQPMRPATRRYFRGIKHRSS